MQLSPGPARSTQTKRLGTWHHVLLTPYAPMRFVCVDRAGPGDNCIDFNIPEPDQPLLQLD